MSEWEAVIGLEVHAQLSTVSKIFSGAATAYGAEPNRQACAIDLGLPGVLPVLNKKAVEMAIRFGLSTHSTVANHSVFARKNYFYPDLPKGYQISQYELPIVHNGHIDVILEDGETLRVNLVRAHLEEDAGKSLHEDFHGMSGIDLNRAGTALLEIVTAPDMKNAKEAVAYLKTLHSLVRYLGICDGNMQEGSFRCDANVSVRRKGDPKLGTRTETKNVNSFRFVERAINYEIARQIEVLENGGTVQQETRLFDAQKNETRMMRSKEEATDYRYFPDPDLLPLHIDDSWIHRVRNELPELPWEKRERFQQEYGLSTYDANVLISDMALSNYYEEVLKHRHVSPKTTANWVLSELLGVLNKNNLTIEECPISSEQMAQLLERLEDNTLSGKLAKIVFEALWNQEGTVDAIIDARNLRQMTDDSALINAIEEVMRDNPTQLADYRSGKDKLFGFFVGQVMKKTGGKANPEQLNKLLKDKLHP